MAIVSSASKAARSYYIQDRSSLFVFNVSLELDLVARTVGHGVAQQVSNGFRLQNERRKHWRICAASTTFVLLTCNCCMHC